jgi:hypothetical protein
MLKNTTNVTKDKIILADSTIIAIDREKNMITH